MDIKRKIYFSLLGKLISTFQNWFASLSRPFMVYGYKSKFDSKYYKTVRVSSSAVILSPEKFDVDESVWIWHHSIIDASNGVKIGKGCQIGAWVGIFSHSSHISIRLYGDKYIHVDKHNRVGYSKGGVIIGEYTFIAAGAIITQGVNIGKGCIISAGSFVKNNIPDYSIVAGNPAKVVGSVDRLDKKFLEDTPALMNTYFDKEYLELMFKK